MHSTAPPSLLAFFGDLLLYRQSNPILPFPPDDPAAINAITAELDGLSR